MVHVDLSISVRFCLFIRYLGTSSQTRIAEVAELFTEYTVRPLSRFVDGEFDLMLLALRINDIEDAFIFSDGIPMKLDTDLSRARKIRFLDLDMLVQPLDDIIKYKKLLKRNNDVSDLIKLK